MKEKSREKDVKMSKGLLGYKVENPTIQILSNHLNVEAEIFKAKNDIYSLNWAIFALIGGDKEREKIIERSIKALKKESENIIREDFDLTTELVVKFALGVRILKYKEKISNDVNEFVKSKFDLGNSLTCFLFMHKLRFIIKAFLIW